MSHNNLRSNDLMPECILTRKVYDWVFDSNRYKNKAQLPEECWPAIDRAVAAGADITIDCTPITSGPRAPKCSVSPRRRDVTLPGGITAQEVSLLFSLFVRVTIYANGTIICGPLEIPVQFDEDVVLCAPRGTRIECNITEVNCEAFNRVILDHMVSLDVTICWDIEVLRNVKLEVMAKFCHPRPNDLDASQSTRFRCTMPEFPPQCPDIFPRPNCDCQAQFDVEVYNTPVVFGTGTTANNEGTQILRGTICNDCTLGESKWRYQFIDTDTSTPTPGDQTFRFKPLTIDQPQCTTTVEKDLFMTVTGIGVMRFTQTGQEERVTYRLTLRELATGSFDSFELVLTNSTGTQVFVNHGGAIFTRFDDEDLEIRDCLTFGDLPFIRP